MDENSAPTVENTPTAPPPSSPEPAAAPPASTGETSAPPPSATPDQGETRETLLQHVQKAVPELRTSHDAQQDAGGVPLAPAAPSGAAPSGQAKPAEDDLPDEVTAEELARYHPSAKRRVEKLIEQRRT